MKKIKMGNERIDFIDLKCLVVSKGVRVDPAVYERFSGIYNISTDLRRLSCLIFSDGTVATFTDMEPVLERWGQRYFWTPEEKTSYHPQLQTPFFVRVQDDRPALFFHEEFLDYVTFPKKNNFYDQVTSDGLPFCPSAVLQGTDWLTFGYLWPCEFAKAGMPCQFCHCGNETSARVKNKQPFDPPITGQQMTEIIRYAVESVGSQHVQITGGSTFEGKTEHKHFQYYLQAIHENLGREKIPGDIVFYITPPRELALVDEYIENGVDQIACSVEVWDEKLAQIITPGKMKYTTRQRHLDVLQHIVEKYGPHHCFCNFVVGLEPVESMAEGARWLAERGITPAVSIWQPAGLTVNGSMTPPGLDYYRAVKELFLELYAKYDLKPAERTGENGCIEEEFYRAVHASDA